MKQVTVVLNVEIKEARNIVFRKIRSGIWERGVDIDGKFVRFGVTFDDVLPKFTAHMKACGYPVKYELI